MAKRFVFRLQPVLDQRILEEEARQVTVATLERQRLEVEDRIRGYQRGISAAKEDLRARLGRERDAVGSGMPSSVSLADVRLQANASLHLASRAQQAVFELAGVHQHLDGARIELLRATAARKAVELLKTRRYEEWRREEQRREGAALDELSTMRHGRHGKPAVGDAA